MLACLVIFRGLPIGATPLPPRKVNILPLDVVVRADTATPTAEQGAYRADALGERIKKQLVDYDVYVLTVKEIERHSSRANVPKGRKGSAEEANAACDRDCLLAVAQEHGGDLLGGSVKTFGNTPYAARLWWWRFKPDGTPETSFSGHSKERTCSQPCDPVKFATLINELAADLGDEVRGSETPQETPVSSAPALIGIPDPTNSPTKPTSPFPALGQPTKHDAKEKTGFGLHNFSMKRRVAVAATATLAVITLVGSIALAALDQSNKTLCYANFTNKENHDFEPAYCLEGPGLTGAYGAGFGMSTALGIGIVFTIFSPPIHNAVNH
jgi:hypothetical protein